MARRIDRRMFLQGAAGFSLAIPFLPSLVSEPASAQSTNTKRFVAFGTGHGGVWQENMYPADTMLTETASYAGHQIRRGDLTLLDDGGMATLSPVLRAANQRLTPTLAGKLNVLRGFDIPFYIGHNSGSYLGNYAANNGDGDDGVVVQASPRPTIDQLLAWSPSFYGNLGTILERSMVMGHITSMSYGWSNPSAQSGQVQVIAPQESNLALFDRIFVPPPENPEEERPPVVDRILEDYRRLRDGNRRLSSRDRQRLTEHLDRLDELERRLGVVVSCEDIVPPTVDAGTIDLEAGGVQADIQYWQLMNDVIVAAFACDTCRIATALLSELSHFSDYPGDWHQEVAHQADYVSWSSPPTGHPQDVLTQSKQAFFEHVFLDLAAKLDAVEDASGGTLLDGTLVQWTQESGVATHESIEAPVVTAGSAGGYFQTGSYCDYRDQNASWRVPEPGYVVSAHRGLMYNQWLGTVLQAMGLSPAEYESGGHGGYGEVYFGYEGGYPSTGPVVDAMGDRLPLITS